MQKSNFSSYILVILITAVLLGMIGLKWITYSGLQKQEWAPAKISLDENYELSPALNELQEALNEYSRALDEIREIQKLKESTDHPTKQLLQACDDADLWYIQAENNVYDVLRRCTQEEGEQAEHILDIQDKLGVFYKHNKTIYTQFHE